MSEIKVNKISPRSGTTVTLGDSGDTFTIPSGATINNQGTATNFGATGSASWTTTVKTSGFTAVAGEGYFVDTSSGAVSVNLPAGTAGAVVAFKDYLNSFDTHALTLVQNGSDKIGGSADNVQLSEEGIAVTLVFVDSTQGWLVTDSGLQSEAPSPQFITATGGTITTVCTNFKVHTFTSPGTFCVSAVGNSAGSNEVSYMVVAGGGGTDTGNPGATGGGGAGGFREGKTPQDSYTSSPVACTAGANNGLPVAVTGYPVTVGAGGAGGPNSGPTSAATSGSNSVFSGTTTITSAGGGKASNPTESGGSGGGGITTPAPAQSPSQIGTGNTPPTTPPQGNPGALGLTTSPSTYRAGGGGGATAAGAAATPSGAGAGGAGATTSINGSSTAFAGGGGGGSGREPTTPTPVGNVPAGAGGAGGGGAGGERGDSTAGTVNTGGGAGGSGYLSGPGSGAAGGSGIVIIRYKFQ
jgi:hypothetical protein